MADPLTELFWRLPIDSFFKQIGGSATGLTSIEAANRLARWPMRLRTRRTGGFSGK